jgi:hypothetical protein
MRGPKGADGFIANGFLACVLGVLLTVGTVWAHSACIATLHLCLSRGDGNMSYWFHSLVAIPAFWLLMFAFPGADEPAQAQDLTQHNAAVARALNHFRKRETTDQRCPSCGETILVTKASAGSSILRTACRCGKWSGTYEFSRSDA